MEIHLQAEGPDWEDKDLAAPFFHCVGNGGETILTANGGTVLQAVSGILDQETYYCHQNRKVKIHHAGIPYTLT